MNKHAIILGLSLLAVLLSGCYTQGDGSGDKPYVFVELVDEEFNETVDWDSIPVDEKPSEVTILLERAINEVKISEELDKKMGDEIYNYFINRPEMPEANSINGFKVMYMGYYFLLGIDYV